MAFRKLFSVLLLQLLLVVLVLDSANASALKLGFYSKTCPRAEAVVTKTTSHFISRSPSLAPALLRLHFHDCLVRGCDASVLLISTKINQAAEKESHNNLSLRGFQVIDAAKSALEKICPGVVSCADILASVARDAVSMIYGPYWEVPTGRRDGRVSIAFEAVTNLLPSPYANVTQLKANFASKGLNVKDLVVLSGAHTIGISHCSIISTRLYNFTGKGDPDPKLDRHYAANLKKKCKPWDTETILEMDPGLFQSDASLLDDVETKAYVQFQAIFHGATFAQDFAASMVKMGQIGVLTGKAGEIRKHCALVN
ncbi:hypothetical protein UlMin_022881 [Ulmus minor]